MNRALKRQPRFNDDPMNRMAVRKPVTWTAIAFFSTFGSIAIVEDVLGLKGVPNLERLEIQALFGKVSVGPEHLEGFDVSWSGRPLPASLRKGLVLDCSFDRDEGGKVSDRSDFGNHGNVHGARWIATGKRGGAYRFDGTRDYISFRDSHSLDIQGAELTISAWVRPSAMGSTASPIVSKWADDTLGHKRAWFLSIGHAARAGKLLAGWHNLGNNNGENWRLVVGNEELELETWKHTALTIREGEASLFIDGQLDSTTTAGSFGTFFNNDRPVYIGGGELSMSSGFKYYKGTIDEVLIFNRALSHREIEEIYRHQK